MRRDAGGLQRPGISHKLLRWSQNESKRTKPNPSNTASTIPAVIAEQLSAPISRGTEMCRVIAGSLSMIMSIPSRQQ